MNDRRFGYVIVGIGIGCGIGAIVFAVLLIAYAAGKVQP